MKILISLVVLLITLPAMAESKSTSYRCGNSLVHLGVTLYEVQDLCGQSDGVYRWQETVTLHNRYDRYGNVLVRSDSMERWTYADYGKFDTYLIFRNGNLVRIVQGRR